MLLSVIIPAYNAAKTLPESLASVAGSHAEVIVIDDGSTDQTEAVAGWVPGIRLVRQTNRGVSAARNTGISRAAGDFIIFLDADDTVEENALDALEALIPDCRADMVILRSFSGSSERYPWNGLFQEGVVLSKEEILRQGYLRGSVCGCAFRRSFLQDNALDFPEGIPLSEDLVFWACCLDAGAKVQFRDIPFYQVHERPDSASRKVDGDYLMRSSLALEAAVKRISDPALQTAVCLSIIMGMIHIAVPAGYSPSRLLASTRIPSVLPLPVAGTLRNKLYARLLNASFPLFFRLKQFRDLC